MPSYILHSWLSPRDALEYLVVVYRTNICVIITHGITTDMLQKPVCELTINKL